MSPTKKSIFRVTASNEHKTKRPARPINRAGTALDIEKRVIYEQDIIFSVNMSTSSLLYNSRTHSSKPWYLLGTKDPSLSTLADAETAAA